MTNRLTLDYPLMSTPARLMVRKLIVTTVVVMVMSLNSDAETVSNHQGTSQLLKPLPDGLTSFGAMTLGDYLYVFSGHHGAAHTFGKQVLSNHFRRIRYADPTAHWEELAMHHPAQSVSLVTDGQYIYRIAGLSFRNSGAEETDFDSTLHFARFDPILNQWEDLADLPEGRSSLDAAVVGRSIYVVGGWNLQGNSSTSAHWHHTMLRFDLDAPEAGWHTLPGPGYDIRALSVAAHGSSLYAMGGMTPKGISRKVSRFDPATEQWSQGPELPADHRTAGFATSAFASQGRLYNAGSSGILYRLSDDGRQWEIADRLLFPRNFLRLIPGGQNHLLAVGGTSGTGRSAAVEWIDVSATALDITSTTGNSGKLATWSVEFPGQAHEYQSVWSDGNKLITVGGGACPEDEVFEFDLTLRTVRQLSPLPVPLRDATLLSNNQTSEHQSLVMLGGMSLAGTGDNSSGNSSGRRECLQPRSEIFEYDFAADQWTATSVELPFPLGMHCAVRGHDALWMFGGIVPSDQSPAYDKANNLQIIHWWGDESSPTAIPNAKLPRPRRLGGGALVGDEVFLIGGVDANNEAVNQVDVFNFHSRSWRQINPPQQSRMRCSVVSIGKIIYLFGGYVVTPKGQAIINSLEMYDTELNQWQVVAERLPGIDGSMHMLSLDSRLLFFGIDSQTPNIARFALYSPDAPTTDQSPFTTVSGALAGAGSGQDQEIVKNARLLMRRDSDKDGRLSRSELGSRMEDFFTRADLDQDQFLTFEEIAQALEAEKDFP